MRSRVGAQPKISDVEILRRGKVLSRPQQHSGFMAVFCLGREESYGIGFVRT